MATWSDFEKQFENLNNGLIAFYRCEDKPSGIAPHQAAPNGNNAEVSDRVNGQDFEFFNQTEKRKYDQGISSGLNLTNGLVFHNTSGVAPLGANTDAQYARTFNITNYLDFGPSSPLSGASMTLSMWIKFKDLKRDSNLIKKSGDGVLVPANTAQYSLTHSASHPATSSPEDNIIFNKFASSPGVIDAQAFTGFVDPGGAPQGQSYNLQVDKWYHVVAIYDRLGKFKPHQAGGCVYVIVNSAEAGSGAPGWDRIADARNFEEQGFLGGPCSQPDSALSSSMQNSNTEVWLGPVDTTAHGGDFSHVVFDQIGVWRRILGSGEIKALFNDGFGVNLPFTTVSVSGQHVFGGFVTSKTPTDATPSGLIGGYVFAAQQFGPSGIPKGIVPVVGGFLFAPQQKSVNFGGFVFSKPRLDQRNHNFFGGYTRAPGFSRTDFFGGFVMAQPLQSAPTAFIGGTTSGLYQFGPDETISSPPFATQKPQIGGWMFGRPPQTEYIEQHSRTLVKVRSENVVDQALDLDSQIILFQRDNQNFNAKLISYSTGSADFNAKIDIDAIKLLPSSVMTATCVTDASGVTQLSVEASGVLYEPGTFFVNAQIDFGEPYDFINGLGGFANPTFNSSISGFNLTQLAATNNVVSGVHNYKYPGKYVAVATFIDNLGQTTSSAFIFNTISSGTIASSASIIPVEGVDYPAIEISGVPRQGQVPPNLQVNFSLNASGISTGPVGVAVSKLNATTPNTNPNLQWNFDNGIISTIKQPFSTYVNPGLYIPVARYQFIHPSGKLVSPSGGAPSGLGPLYTSRPVWISDSLVIGYNI